MGNKSQVINSTATSGSLFQYWRSYRLPLSLSRRRPASSHLILSASPVPTLSSIRFSYALDVKISIISDTSLFPTFPYST